MSSNLDFEALTADELKVALAIICKRISELEDEVNELRKDRKN